MASSLVDLPFRETTKVGDLHRTFQANDKANWGLLATPVKVISSLWNIAAEAFSSQNPPFNPQQSIYFVTSRAAKFSEVAKLLKGLPLVQKDLLLPSLEKTKDLAIVAAYRALKAFKQTQGATLLEETALDVKVDGYENAYPGRFFKEVVELGMGKRAFAELYKGCAAIFRTVFAYTEDGKTVHVFNNEVSGKIVHPGDEWEEGDGSDPLFQMNGYQVPMSRLNAYKHFLYARQFPCAELRTMIERKTYAGVYELHVTVANTDIATWEQSGQNPLHPKDEYVDTFRQACNEIGVKSLVIQMDNQKKPDQLQTAVYVSCKEGYPEAQKKIHGIAQDLLKRGFPIVRNRIEAMLHNQETPKNDDEALVVSDGNYFEFHARLAEVPPDKKEAFKKILSDQPSSGLGSYEKGRFSVAFSTVGGGERYFVNAKAHKVGASTALIAWEALLKELEENGFAISKRVKPEYCIFDEKPNLDYLEIQ